MEVDDFNFRFNTTKLHLYFGNLFNGDKALGKWITELIYFIRA